MNLPLLPDSLSCYYKRSSYQFFADTNPPITLGFHWYISGFAHRPLYLREFIVYLRPGAQPGNGPKKFGININITEEY